MSEKQKRDYWDSTGQVFFLDGQGWALTPHLTRFVLGKEATILEALKTGKIPEDATLIQRAEYERILEIQREEVDAQSKFRPKSGSSIRSRPTGATKHRTASPKHTSVRKRIPRNKIKR